MNVSIVIALGFTVIALSGFLLRAFFLKRRIRRSSSHGQIMEERAADLLTERGFRILERHPKIQYVWSLDDEPVETVVEADYLVLRDGVKAIVEVKTGNSARPNRRETRRQLLEYSLYGNVEKLFFLDADRNELRSVSFPIPVIRRVPQWIWITLFVSICTTLTCLYICLRD